MPKSYHYKILSTRPVEGFLITRESGDAGHAADREASANPARYLEIMNQRLQPSPRMCCEFHTSGSAMEKTACPSGNSYGNQARANQGGKP